MPRASGAPLASALRVGGVLLSDVPLGDHGDSFLGRQGVEPARGAPPVPGVPERAQVGGAPSAVKSSAFSTASARGYRLSMHAE